MRRWIIAFLLVGGTAAASPGPNWTVRGFSTERWLSDPSAVTLSTSPMSGGGLAIERRALTLALPGPFPTLDITGDLDWDSQATDGSTFQGQLVNHVSSWELTAGARARLPLVSWLALQARAAVGGARTHVRIADTTMTTSIADAGNSSVFETGVGLSALPKVGSNVRLGVDIELGYQQTTAVHVSATPENRPSPDLTIPASYASLGSLDLDGWSLRIGATIGF